MADMCGPSNALSSFQKHSTVDRTLQQDRLIARQSPSQGFRSVGPNARHLDPEFEAFQAGNLPLDHTFQYSPHFQQQQHSFQSAPGPANWASDFRQLSIAGPQPSQQQSRQGFGAQIPHRDGGLGWDQEFSRQQNQLNGMNQAQAQQQSGYMQGMPTMGMGVGMGLGMSQYPGFQAPQESLQSEAQMQQPVEQFDDAAFERAFQEFAEAEDGPGMQESKQSEAQSQDQYQDSQASTIALEDDLRLSPSTNLETVPISQPLIGADTIHDPNKPAEMQQADPDALARTARDLIHKLSGDTRSKMQGSEFMKLMRNFADGKQEIRGDEVVAGKVVGESKVT